MFSLLGPYFIDIKLSGNVIFNAKGQSFPFF